MKAKIFPLVILILIGFSSCEKEPSDEVGDISGMGLTPGDIEIKKSYELPKGIALVNQMVESDIQDPTYTIFGSGGHIKINMTLINATSSVKTIFFPQGLILKNSAPGNHSGILLQTTWITLGGNTQRDITLCLYCINARLHSASLIAPFNFHGVTASSTMTDLLELISNRRINYEMIYGSVDGSDPLPPSGPAYSQIIARLETIVWNLTDFDKGISADDIDFIENIPMLSPSEIPGQPFPDYFPEFVVPGK